MRRRRRSRRKGLLLLATIVMIAGAIAMVVSLDLPSGEKPAGDELTRTTEKPLVMGGGSNPETADLRERKPNVYASHPSEESFGKTKDTPITLSEEEFKTALYEAEGHSPRTQWVLLALMAAAGCSLYSLYRFKGRQRRRHRRRHYRRYEMLPDLQERNTLERTVKPDQPTTEISGAAPASRTPDSRDEGVDPSDCASPFVGR